jgi:hypothetical protein
MAPDWVPPPDGMEMGVLPVIPTFNTVPADQYRLVPSVASGPGAALGVTVD